MNMAPTSHGRNGQQGRENLANASVNNGPPPSTLAAQLVENISASTRSSRPDETAELKKFFSIIEEVKNNPETLESHQDRIEHNHMLIYVFSRVVLEGLRWDDPFADREHLHSEAVRAINFLKVTVRETPEVLVLSSPGTSFIFRGNEPLWLWILPRVLKMLGHSQCLNLTTAIESLFQDLSIVVAENGFLWPLASRLDQYLRSNFDGMTMTMIIDVRCKLLTVIDSNSGPSTRKQSQPFGKRYLAASTVAIRCVFEKHCRL